MSLSSYAGLKGAIADYLQRTDLTSAIIDFVTLAEAMIAYGDAGNDIEPLRVRQMETVGTGTLSGGDFTLATDFLEMVRATYIGSSRVPLTYLTPNDLDAMFPDVASGDPQFFTVIAATFSLRPTATGTVSYTYYQQIPALADLNTSNWLLAAAPQVYLYATLFQAAIYLQSPEQAQAYLGLYRSALMGFIRSQRGAMAGQHVVRASMPAW